MAVGPQSHTLCPCLILPFHAAARHRRGGLASGPLTRLAQFTFSSKQMMSFLGKRGKKMHEIGIRDRERLFLGFEPAVRTLLGGVSSEEEEEQAIKAAWCLGVGVAAGSRTSESAGGGRVALRVGAGGCVGVCMPPGTVHVSVTLSVGLQRWVCPDRYLSQSGWCLALLVCRCVRECVGGWGLRGRELEGVVCACVCV